MVRIDKRVRSYFRSHMQGIERRVDRYLSSNLPDLIGAYKLARKPDIQGIEKGIEEKEVTIEELSNWKEETADQMENLDKRVARLETKYGVK